MEKCVICATPIYSQEEANPSFLGIVCEICSEDHPNEDPEEREER